MRKEDNSPQGKIVTELLQHLHSCKNNCDVFYGREEELERMKDYITGPSTKPFVLYGAGGSGKSALLSKTALMSIKEWLQPAVPKPRATSSFSWAQARLLARLVKVFNRAAW